MRRRTAAILVVVAAAWAEDAERFQKLHELIVPHRDEVAWTEVDWGTDLWEARRTAAEQGKPIFLWEMDGHPLGCT